MRCRMQCAIITYRLLKGSRLDESGITHGAQWGNMGNSDALTSTDVGCGVEESTARAFEMGLSVGVRAAPLRECLPGNIGKCTFHALQEIHWPDHSNTSYQFFFPTIK